MRLAEALHETATATLRRVAVTHALAVDDGTTRDEQPVSKVNAAFGRKSRRGLTWPRGDRGGDRTRGPRIKRTAGDRPPRSTRCFSLGTSGHSPLVRPPVSTGCRRLVCQLVCHPEAERRAAIVGAGDPCVGSPDVCP